MCLSRCAALVLLGVAASALPAGAQELKPDLLAKVKAATAFIKTARGTGSGYLFRKSGSAAFLISCAHVVGNFAEVEAVFASGSKSEKSFAAQIVATDSDRDLACLVIRNGKDLPAPLELGAKTEVRETENVFVSGFPFGEMLSASSRNPEISLSKASVSSIRKDDYGIVVVVQLSGDVNPGNSGGPVIDAKGRVIGVAQSKILLSQTAFAVSSEEIRGFLKGRIKSLTVATRETGAGGAKVEAVMELIDPMGTLKSAGIAWMRQSDLKAEPKPEKDGFWTKAHPSMKEVTLKISDDATGASATFDVPKASGDGATVTLVVQSRYTQADGTTHWTEPGTSDVSLGTAAAGGGAGAAVKPAAPGEDVKPVKPSNAVSVEAVTERDPQGRSYLRVVSNVEKINLGPGLRQIVSAPSGRAVYAIYKDQAVVKVYDPAGWSLVREITTPQFPASVWCDEKRVVVACTESKVITFIDPDAGKPVKSVPVKDKDTPADFQPLRVVGKAPDGSLMTLWRAKDAARWDTWLYHLQENGQTRRILKGDLEWTCYAGPKTLLGQRNFRGSPSGVPELFDVASGRAINLYANKLFGENAGWHRCFAQIFPTFDRRHLVLPTLKIGGEGYGYQTWTYVVDPGLTKSNFDFPGAAFAEVPSEGILVSWGLVYNVEKGQTTPKPEVFYAGRSNGRVIRRVATKNYDPHPAQFQYVNADRNVAYVAGHELVLATDLNDRNGVVFVIRCGPVAADAKVGADPGITVTNDPPAKATVGKEVTYAPSFQRPAGAKSIVFKLKKGPEEIKLDAATGKFAWKPSDAYIGKFDVAIVAEVDGAEVPVVAWTIEIGF